MESTTNSVSLSDKQRGEFEQEYCQNKDAFLKYTYRLCRSRDLAEDILEDATVKALAGFPNFKRDSKFTTWFYRIITNCHLDYMRQVHPLLESETIKRSEDAAGKSALDELIVNDEGDRSNQKIVVHEAVAQLEDMYRIPIILYHFQDKSYEEIAGIINCPINTVKVRIYRGRQSIKYYLEFGVTAGLQP